MLDDICMGAVVVIVLSFVALFILLIGYLAYTLSIFLGVLVHLGLLYILIRFLEGSNVMRGRCGIGLALVNVIIVEMVFVIRSQGLISFVLPVSAIAVFFLYSLVPFIDL